MKKILILISFLTIASTASAEPILYECNYNGKGTKGWIMERAFYAIDEVTVRARVFDAAVAHANNDKAKAAQLEIRKGNVYVLKYHLKLPARGNREIGVGYRVRLDATRLRASITVQPGNSDIPDVGTAKCRLAK